MWNKNTNKKATQRVLVPALLKPCGTTPLPTAPRMLPEKLHQKSYLNPNPNPTPNPNLSLGD